MPIALRPYPAYRDSRIGGLGRVPIDWDVRPLKRCVAINRNVLPESTDPAFRFRYLDIGTVGTGRLVKEPESILFEHAPSRARRIVKSGDTLVSTVRTYLRAVYFVEDSFEDCIASTGFAVLSPGEGTQPRFLGSLVQSEYFVNQVILNSIGVAYPAIAESRLAALPVALPPEREQDAIVRFLAHIDRRVNRLIRAKRRLIALLNEQKQAIIHRAVTRGLDPDVRLKPSGVDWLGDIPEHWEVRRNGRLFTQRNETGFADLPILEVSLRRGVRVRTFENSDRKQVVTDRSKYKRAVCGDIAYNMMRMWQGAVGVAPIDGLVSPAYVVARPTEGTATRYFESLFRTAEYMSEVDKCSRGIVKDRNRLYWEDFKGMGSCYPPPHEQEQIVWAIDNACCGIDNGIGRVERELSLVREYRARLIADVVTGKLDVREAAASLPDQVGEPEIADEAEEEVLADDDITDTDAIEADD